MGDEAGTVGVGCAAAGEVVQAVKRASTDAKRNLVSIPLNKNQSFPHRFDGIAGAAKARQLQPARTAVRGGLGRGTALRGTAGCLPRAPTL